MRRSIMGYRSDVRSVIYGSTDRMQEFMKAHELLVDKVNYSFGLEEFTDGSDTILHLHDSDVKWYEDYPEVMAWNKLMELAEQAGLASEFIEIGQNVEDFTTISAGPSRGIIGFERKTVLKL